jgi:hypothetical protein
MARFPPPPVDEREKLVVDEAAAKAFVPDHRYTIQSLQKQIVQLVTDG